jgi:hypothetical protein
MKLGWANGLVGGAVVVVLGVLGWLLWPWKTPKIVQGQCTAVGTPSTLYDVLVYPTVANWARCTVNLDPCLRIANHDRVQWHIASHEPSTVVKIKALPSATPPPLNSAASGIPVNPSGQPSSGPVDIASGAVAGTYPYQITHGGIVCVDPKVILK